MLLDLSNDGHTYWKFSQSQKGRSVEPVFLLYTPGDIIAAKDPNKLLSFVDDKHIAGCYMYGDILTKISMDIKNPFFEMIADLPVHYIGGPLGEYECKKLLVEENYPLQYKDSLRRLLSMASEFQIQILLFGRSYNFIERLNRFGFSQSVELMTYLAEVYETNKERKNKKELLLQIVDEYKNF